MNRRVKLVLTIVLVAAIVVSLLVIYENSVLNPAGSSFAWQRPIENFATGIAADKDNVFTMDISGNVKYYETQTGASVWNGSSVGGYFASGLTVAERRVYGGYRYDSVGCLNEVTGQLQWNVMGIFDHNQAPEEIIVQNGRLFVVAEGAVAGVNAYNTSTGQPLWQVRYSFADFRNISDSATWWVTGFPLGGNPFEGNYVYAIGGSSSDATIFKLNTEKGAPLWSFNAPLNEGIPSVVATYQGQVIVENGRQILSLNQTTGGNLWSINVGASIYSPIAYQGSLLFGASDGNFYRLDLKSGTISCTTKVNNQLLSTVNQDNPLTILPIQIDSDNQRIYWEFGVTEQDQFKADVVCLDLDTCNLAWTKTIEDSHLTPESPQGLAVSKDSVFLTENTALWVFSASNGNLARNQQFTHYILPPVKSGDTVFVAADMQLTAYK